MIVVYVDHKIPQLELVLIKSLSEILEYLIRFFYNIQYISTLVYSQYLAHINSGLKVYLILIPATP